MRLLETIRNARRGGGGAESERRERKMNGNGSAEPAVVPLGEAEDGGRVQWRPEDNAAHLLLVGPPASSKSFTVRSILAHAKRHQEAWRAYLIDPKRVEFGGYTNHPAVAEVATEMERLPALLAELRAEVERRYKLMEAEGANSLDMLNEALGARGEAALSRLLVVIDEVAEVTAETGHSEAEDTLRREAKDSLEALVRLGRGAGVHAVICTQMLDAAHLPGATLSNIQARVAFAGLSRGGSRAVIEDEAAAALPRLSGRGIYYECGQLTEFRTYPPEPEKGGEQG